MAPGSGTLLARQKASPGFYPWVLRALEGERGTRAIRSTIGMVGREVGGRAALGDQEENDPKNPFFFFPPKFLLLQSFPKVSKPRYGPTGWVPPGTAWMSLSSRERGPA